MREFSLKRWDQFGMLHGLILVLLLCVACADERQGSRPTEGDCTDAQVDCLGLQLPQNCVDGSWTCKAGQCRAVCGDPENDECLSDRIDLPADEYCTCKCDDCDCTVIVCNCSQQCNGDVDCLINVDENGNSTTIDDFLANCDLTCTLPNDDAANQITCTVVDCEITSYIIQLTPDEIITPGSLRIERGIRNTGIIFPVDTSGSMQPKQMASACAMEAFFEAAGNAEYTIGISTMDVIDLYDGNYAMMGDAHLVGLDGSCTTHLECDCGGSHHGDVCPMIPNDGMVSSKDPEAQDLLRKLIVQGGNEASNNDEAGLEKAFRLLYKNLPIEGEIAQVVLLSDEKANSDDEMCPIQSHRYDPDNLSALRAVLGSSFDPPANTGDCDTDLTNFYTYFFTRFGIQVSVLVDTDQGSGDYAEVYMAVAQATGGAIGDIYKCEGFVDFFKEVGISTNTLSTQICLGYQIDPDTLTVVHVDEVGVSHDVPQSNSDGWSYDQSLNCIILNGSWKEVYGTFEISYEGLLGEVGSEVCFPPGIDPLPDSLKVFYQGEEIPQSSSDGWTFDPLTDCITLHGSWAGVEGPFDIHYL